MDRINWIINKIPVPVILHNNDQIVFANEAFKGFLTKDEDITKLAFLPWLITIVKNKAPQQALIEGFENGSDFSISTDANIKGTVKHLKISSFLIPQIFSPDKHRLTVLEDLSPYQGSKSYWDLHLRVSKATMQLIKEIEQRKKLEAQTAELNNQLILTARRAGMADVATSVLHNIGNILNSVKVSITVLNKNLEKKDFNNLIKVIHMVQDNIKDINHFFTEDEKGKLIPQYLSAVVKALVSANKTSHSEVKNLLKYIQHIEDIVSIQESASTLVKVEENISLSATLDAGLQLCGGTFEKNNIEIQKLYGEDILLVSDKFKILQILVNLLQNAKDALLLSDVKVPVKIISIKAEKKDSNVNIFITDNGVGIEPENITKIFSMGFTTKKHGHGYGLHSSGLAAKELGGELVATSPGVGQGSTFTLTIPINIRNTGKH